MNYTVLFFFAHRADWLVNCTTGVSGAKKNPKATVLSFKTVHFWVCLVRLRGGYLVIAVIVQRTSLSLLKSRKLA